MIPSTPLPHNEEFSCAEEYVESLLKFSTTSQIFQTLCGGIHILDFFTQEKSLYHTVIPSEWRQWLLAQDSMALLDFFMRDDLNAPMQAPAPKTLIDYVHQIRKHSLRRKMPTAQQIRPPVLPRHVAVGMIPKKVHEVTNFAQYVAKVADDIAHESGQEITHFLDLGSGQNYLGRALASNPYNKHIVAVENKALNISGAKNMDVVANVAKRETVWRNKKVYRQQQSNLKQTINQSQDLKQTTDTHRPSQASADFRPTRELKTIYTPQDGKGFINYIQCQIRDADFSYIISQIEENPPEFMPVSTEDGVTKVSDEVIPVGKGTCLGVTIPKIMVISIHSCGNLSHHGIRSLLLNPTVSAIAIVGCCYNLLSERFGAPSIKHPLLRPNQNAINSSLIIDDNAAGDPHGYPMSKRVASYSDDGLRLNITSRMMAVQAPWNWTKKESDDFFTRHYYRALLQRIFLDWGVVHLTEGVSDGIMGSTEPIIIGSLRKGCFLNFRLYVRGAIDKLLQKPGRCVQNLEKMKEITDEQIDEYILKHGALKKELSITWSLMSFSAGVVESLIVVDRWLFLKESPDIVRECWVEPVFNYELSPRNLVVVGIKR